MLRRQPARFRILRLDPGPQAGPSPYQALWRVDGQTFRVSIWDLEQWERIPWADRPDDARPLDGGWMLLTPVDPRRVSLGDSAVLPDALSP